ncbi:hypothetical protein [Streptomyces xiamenensis]|uniref:hypothetical protein n=1 Tax=Streptomyces xiamenensis TaxID=408015 RepID=UPI0035D5A414
MPNPPRRIKPEHLRRHELTLPRIRSEEDRQEAIKANLAALRKIGVGDIITTHVIDPCETQYVGVVAEIDIYELLPGHFGVTVEWGEHYTLRNDKVSGPHYGMGSISIEHRQVLTVLERASEHDLPMRHTPSYGRFATARKHMQEAAHSLRADFAKLMRSIYPEAAHLLMYVNDDGDLRVLRAVAPKGATVTDFSGTLPPEHQQQWNNFRLLRERDVDMILATLQDAGIPFEEAPDWLQGCDEETYHLALS